MNWIPREEGDYQPDGSDDQGHQRRRRSPGQESHAQESCPEG
jgi:hypothetical protein